MATDYTKIIRKLFPVQEDDGPGAVTLRAMVVSAVNSDGTVDLTTGGVTIPDVPRLDSAPVFVGANVQVLASRGQLLVLGSSGSPVGWQDYVPSIQATGGSPTLGTATVAARFKVDYATNTCRALGQVTWAANTSTGTGTFYFTVPVPARALNPSHIGTAFLIDASGGSTGRYTCSVELDSVNRFLMVNSRDGAIAGQTLPFPWTTSDQARWEICYEI